MSHEHQGRHPLRISLDRRAAVLCAAVIIGLALLLAAGLLPGRAATQPSDAQPVGRDDTLLLREDCQIIQRLTYTPCGHSLTRRQQLPPELVGKDRAALAAAYDLWQITAYSPAEVEMSKSVALYCPEHLILMPDESGMLCIWENRYGDALALVSELHLPLSEFSDDCQEELRPGKGFDDEESLSQWLESMDS